MASVIGVRFKNAGKLYYFDPGPLWPTAGDAVIVETVRGVEYGEVVTGVKEVSDELIKAAGGAGSALGTGGMQTKIIAMSMLMDHGIAGVIAEGSQSQILEDILDGEDIGTLFVPHT